MKKMLKTLLIPALLVSSALLLVSAVKTGEKAGDFSLTGSDGKVHKLSDYAGKKAIVLLFVSTRCPVSNAYNARMAQLNKDYAASEVVFLGINSNRTEDMQQIKKQAGEDNFGFVVLQDDGNVVADMFDATVTPEAFVLDGSLTLRYHGRIDDSQKDAHVKRSDLRLALDAILAGKTPEENETMAFGCSIKRVR